MDMPTPRRNSPALYNHWKSWLPRQTASGLNGQTSHGQGENPEPVDVVDASPTGVCFTYAQILARFWYVIGFLVLMTVATFAAVAFTLYELPDFGEPTKGFESRGTLISSRVFSLQNLLSDSEKTLTGQPQTAGASASQSVNKNENSEQPRARRQTSLEANPAIKFCYSVGHWDPDYLAKLVFEGVNGRSILTTEAIKSVCEAEERIVTSHPLYQGNCLCFSNLTDQGCPNTWSLGNYVALLSNKSSCAEIADEDVENVLDLLVLCAPYVYNISENELHDAALSSSFPEACKQHDFAVHTILYYLLPTKFSRDILEGKTPPTSPVTVVFFPIHVIEEYTLETIYQERVINEQHTDGITRLVAVDFYLKFSLFSSILFADSLFLGIGAASIFLLIWVYTGSFFVTLAALLNMIFSLILAYFFFVAAFVRPFFPFANVITAVLIIGVGADDTFVFMDLWKRCKSEFGDQDLPRLVYETLRHASATMFVTSLTTAAALYATVLSNITVVKCFAVYAGTAILMNLVLTLTLLPSVIVMQHKLTIWCCPPNSCSKCSKLECLLKPLKMFLGDFIPFVVFKLRYVWCVLFLALMTGAAVVVLAVPRFQVPAGADFQFYIKSHFFEQYDFVYRNQFSFSEERFSDVVGCIVWGVKAEDNGDTWDPDNFGTLVLDDGFLSFDREVQKWLFNFCQDIRNQSFYKYEVPLDNHYCFMEVFALLIQLPCGGQVASPCCEQNDSPYEPSLFETCLATFANQGMISGVFFRKNDSKPAVVKMTFPTIYPRSFNYATNDELWTTINTWTEEKLRSAPGHLQRGWFSPSHAGISFYDLQQSLASGTIIATLVTLAIASVILLVTIQNLLLTVFAMLAITSAVFVTVASLVLLGWELNVIEATIITLAVGLSVDFTIHYGVAYKLSSSGDRRQRTQFSLRTMTSAITIAALSTFIAGALVLPATVLSYYQIGVFMMLVMGSSWTHSTFFFQSLCMVFGPEQSCGDIPCLPCCDCCRLGTKPRRRVRPSKERNGMQSYDNPSAANMTDDEVVQTISSGQMCR